MPPPLFFSAAVILVWGYLSGFILPALAMAVLVEAPRRLSARWDLSDRDFSRLADFTAVLCVGTALYLFVDAAVQGLFSFVRLLPILLLPLLLSQLYSTRQSIRMSSLFLSLRRYTREGRVTLLPAAEMAARRVDIHYPYLFVCLLSASISKNPLFFPFLCVLAVWGLLPHRRSHTHPALWVFLMGLALGAGYAGQMGVRGLQYQIERWVLTWFEYRMWRHRDPYRQNTAIGDIGKLKQSNRILLRVNAERPLLLREAVYNVYYNGVWRAVHGRFEPLEVMADDYTWKLTTPPPLKNPRAKVEVSVYLNRGHGMLAVPRGSFLLNMPAGPVLEYNPYGALRLSKGPGMLRYTAHYGKGAVLETAPIDEDLRLPTGEEEFFHALAQRLGFHNVPKQAVLHRIEQYFLENFTYTLDLSTPAYGAGKSPLQRFLAEDRRGHCEYFATSTVLLLRAAGIPARYTSGYAAQEYSDLEGAYLVRRRHAHSWAAAYVNGVWTDVDTTPPDWNVYEEEQSAWWESGYDLSAWLYYQISRLRWRETEEEANSEWWLTALPFLFLLLAWRLRARRRRVGKNNDGAETALLKQRYPGEDSIFYRVVEYFEQHGHPRRPHLALRPWLLHAAAVQRFNTGSLREMLRLHERYRFDPAGLSAEEKQRLHQAVETWLNKRNP